jgi:hypothetical protein
LFSNPSEFPTLIQKVTKFASVKAFTNKWLTAAVLLLLISVATIFVWPEIRFRTALQKYKFGITAATIERETGSHIDLRKIGNYLPDGMDDLNKRRHSCYDAHVTHDFIELDFNDFHELIAITKTNASCKIGVPRAQSAKLS